MISEQQLQDWRERARLAVDHGARLARAKKG
jgi:hypothetical protein